MFLIIKLVVIYYIRIVFFIVIMCMKNVLFIEKWFVELMFFFICVFKMGIIRSFFFL